MKWILLLILFLTFDVTSVSAADVDTEISALMKEYHAIGVSVAVVKDKEIIYSKSFGYKDLEDSIPLKTTDLFRIASISKTVVATAIMQLVERCKLSLDDDVNRYLDFKIQNPKFPNIPITIKMLMCHRSSINDSQGRVTFDRINPEKNPNFFKCYCDFAPDAGYIYCNMNYNILGAVIEKVSQERFDRYIYNHIIGPLQLYGSFNGLDLDSNLFVKTYRYNKKKDVLRLVKYSYQPKMLDLVNYEMGYSTTVFTPPGGLIISVNDLARYMMMHMYNGNYRKQIIESNSEKLLRSFSSSGGSSMGITHFNNIIKDVELLGRTGGANGTHSAFVFHPKKKYGFVVLCNGCKSKSINGKELNFEIIRLLYKIISVPLKLGRVKY